MLKLALTCAATGIAMGAAPASATPSDAPTKVNIVDAIDCKLDVPTYNEFAEGLDDGDANARHWTLIPPTDLSLRQYRLPSLITIAGHTTDVIAFSGSGVAAVLDVADPTDIARREHIENAMLSRNDPARSAASSATGASPMPGTSQFRGERVIFDKTDNDAGSHTKFRTRIVRSIASMPGKTDKTLVGCSYSVDVLD